jgi:hypothetical protein
MKYVTDRPYADPEAAMQKLLEYANAFEPIQDGRIYIEKLNGPFLFDAKGTPAEYKAGLELAIERGFLELHESGTYVRFTEKGSGAVRLTRSGTNPSPACLSRVCSVEYLRCVPRPRSCREMKPFIS